ncbi:MAG: glycosyl hydrolase 115 family protein [Bacteroidales bacterium]|nr:glycosyl hydrolase 115 family protein [Bacteroidales bacterium]
MDRIFYLIKKVFAIYFKTSILLLAIVLQHACNSVSAKDITSYISCEYQQGYFSLAEEGNVAPVFISKGDHQGVFRILEYWQNDIKAVTGTMPERLTSPAGKEIVIVGTIGRSDIVDDLIRDEKLDVSDIKGKWEGYLIEVLENPLPGVEKALVIAGSDKRGTIYGIFDLSKNIGVSPWYWWADVPVKKSESLYIKPGRYKDGEPAVKYRGIFLNDEEPSLGRWAVENYDGFNHEFYEKVFELILRLKGNYIWPAMWWASFNSNDTLNPLLADEMGIVVGTSHHEPMMRAHAEWAPYKGGEWNYETNETMLRKFWTEGIERMGAYESIVTIGMRGDGDMAMSEESNIALLERIINDQRTIIQEVTGKDPREIPQLWALYKEVQDYYDKGMRVPEDVTLLLCDDNWGNVRKLPKADSKPRAGGYGMYYHFDFVGGPRNYKWLNTSPISRVWEQMHLTYEYGVDRIWLVNVGDLKPMELPISFFLDYAWDPDAWPAESIPEYHRRWAAQQFGEEHAGEIASILMMYTKFNGRRKPEMIAPDTYSLIHYCEAEKVVEDYNELAEKAEKLYDLVPEEQKDAYYQLVLFPVLASANLNELHVTVGKNHLYANQGRIAANQLGRKVEELFAKDTLLRNHYHDSISGGKWNNMMNQTHISYTYWQQPEIDSMPEVSKVKPGKKAEMGVAIEGSANWWPKEKEEAVLPEFDVYNRQKHYIEVFNQGALPFDFQIKTGKPWLKVSQEKGSIDDQVRIWTEVDWDIVPPGMHSVPIEILGSEGKTIRVFAGIRNPGSPGREEVKGHSEGNGYVSVEAVHFSKAIETDRLHWQIIPDLGRTGSGITPFPVTASPLLPEGDSPRLEYKVHLFDTGTVRVMVYVAPTLNFTTSEGLRYAVSIDDEEPQVMNIHEGDTVPDWKYPDWWNNAVSQNIKILTSEHQVDKPGEHVLKYWMIDPAIVLQKIVIDAGGLKPSYLGPPESFYRLEE